jgi:hypothetical protein
VFLQHPHSGAYVMRQPKADAVPMQLLLLALVGLDLQSPHGGASGGSGGSSHHRPGHHGAAASPSGGAVSSAQRALLRAHALQVLLK